MLYSIRIPWNEADTEQSMARLALFEIAGLTELGHEAEVFFDSLEVARAAASALQASPPNEAPDANWSEPYQKSWQPLAVGKRFYLIPEWTTAEAPNGRIALPMIAGNVFGGGDHATTQLCLEILEQVIQPGMRIADVGAGTAILSRAARALGAQTVACDIDLNTALYVDFLGSADALAPKRFDIVIANIHLRVLEQIKQDLLRICAGNAQLLLSGYLPEQRPALRALFGPELLSAERDGWCAALFAAE